MTHARFAIYETGPFAADGGVSPSHPPMEPVWSHICWKRGDSLLGNFQPIPAISSNQIHFLDPKDISISSYYREAVWTIHIPATTVLETTVDKVELGEYDTKIYGKWASIGRSQGLWWRYHGKLEIAFISWRPIGELEAVRSFGGLPGNARARRASSMELSEAPYNPPEPPATAKFVFEERSGRVVYQVRRKRHTLLLVDYA